MSNIDAKVIEDSISEEGVRLTTIQVRFPRFILPEFNTHRVFSRNFSSSRAIPTKRLLDMIRTEYASPVHWGKNEPGMQANEELKQPQRIRVQSLWQQAAFAAADIAEKMAKEGAHKQIVNRVLEPFMTVSGVVTATDWDNFMELRAHKDAQPEIHALANAIQEAMAASTPADLSVGDWHLPYVTQDERNDAFFADKKDLLRKISAARCCRVSYLKHDGSAASIDEDLKLCERLVGSRPLHASPFEHQATPDVYLYDGWSSKNLWGNFNGWLQHRKLIESELYAPAINP